MDVTVIVCTYNRCQSLTKTLNSVVGSTLADPVEWELLVVDNNSSDQTREVVADFIRRYPGSIRYLLESRPGLSHARNTGIRNARGDVLAFTDDDVTVAPTWLQNLTAALRNNGCMGLGGRVLPERTFTPPRWLSLDGRYRLAPLAIFDLGPEAGELTEAPFGNNMAFRKEAFSKYGGFRTDLGPGPDANLKNEDTELGSRLLAAGERLRYEPSALVYHSIPESRLQKKYFLAWWFDKARADIRQSGIPPGTKWYVMGVPLYLFRRLARWTVTWLLAVGPSVRFSCKLKAWTNLGEIVECYHQAHNATTKDRRI